MFTTEKEAAQKRCTIVHASLSQLPSSEKNAAIVTGGANCIGSACMQWRIAPDKKGFCGLAGVPIGLAMNTAMTAALSAMARQSTITKIKKKMRYE